MRAFPPLLLLLVGCPKAPAETTAIIDAVLATEAALGAAAAPPERAGVVHDGDRPLTLLGAPIEVGAKAPAATLRDHQNQEVTVDLADGKARVLMFVPSLDTPTCSTETRTFNTHASDLGGGVEVVLVSRDLPQAQARFCGAQGIDRVRTLSDFVDGGYGLRWGLYVKETDLLARAVAVIDPAGTVTYLQVVENLPDEPNYEAALTAVRALVPSPSPAPVPSPAQVPGSEIVGPEE